MTLRTTVGPQCDVIHNNFAFGVGVDLHLHRVHFLVVFAIGEINILLLLLQTYRLRFVDTVYILVHYDCSAVRALTEPCVPLFTSCLIVHLYLLIWWN